MKSIYILLAVAALCGCSSSSKKETDAEPVSHTQVTTTTVSLGSITDHISFSAVTAYLKKTTIAAPIPAYIYASSLLPGDIVGRGKVLFLLKSKEQQAIGGNAMPPIPIKAVRKGMIVDVLQQCGSFVPEGTPLCTIADLSSLVFELKVPYEQRHLFRSGSRCELMLPDGTKLSARIECPLISMDATSQTQNIIARARAPFLPEGLIAKAVINVGGGNSARQILPKAAVQTDETMTNYWVMVIKNDSVARRVPVTVGRSNNSEVEVLSPRFNAADKIIETGSYGLTDGALVKVSK